MSSVKETKAKSAADKPEASIEEVFAVLEERVEGLSGRVRELASENARLKGAVIETAAERDRLKKELDDLREVAARQGEAATKLTRYEAERESVRNRIERLVKSLEESESVGTAPVS